ncbi:MAG: TonB-dependent receptor [Mucilaginibacter sp.]
MKKLLTLFTILIACTTAFAQQTGSISGTVTTSDGSAAAYVSVGIIGNRAGAVTDENGAYRIHKLKPGTYTVKVTAVNLASQQKEVTVTAGGNADADFMLSINNSQLQEVVIKDRSNRIKVDNPSQTLRLQEPLLEVPQNIQVVSSTALAEQQIISMSDGVIRNVSGAVRLEHWGDLYTNITMRGSQIQAFRNGFNVVSSFWGPLTEDMSIVDHIEFVKGPAGFMLSQGDPSGLYNVVTKKPTGQTKGEFNFTTGSFGLYRASLDLDGKLSKDGKFLYRLNLAGQNKGSHRPFEHNNRYTVAPVVSYQIDDKTKLTAEYTWQHADMTDIGSFYVFGKDGYATYPVNFTQYAPGTPPTKINDHSLFLNLQHRLNDRWKLTAQAAYFNYSQKGSSMWPDSVGDNGTILRGTDIWDAKSKMTLFQAYLNGNVTTGSVKHRILGGIDMGTKDYMADWIQSHSYDTKDVPFDSNNPNYGVPANGYPVFDRTTPFEGRAVAGGGLIDQTYTALYVQDELGFLDNKIRLTLAGRYTYVKQSAWGGDPITGKKFTPRIGLSVSLTRDMSVYGLYDQAFVPQSGLLTDGGTAKPYTGSNTEFGIKKDWADGKWNTTVSVYQIVKNNEITGDPNLPPTAALTYIVLGQKKSKGIEFDLRGELAKGLTLTANYALTDSRVSQLNPAITPTPGIAVGDIVPGYAKHVANSWLNYKLQGGALKGTGIAAGFTYLAGRETDTWSESDVRLPNYFKLDGGLFWEGSKLRVNANVFNVLDKYLYSGSYYSYLNAFYWQSEAPRNYRLSVTYKF